MVIPLSAPNLGQETPKRKRFREPELDRSGGASALRWPNRLDTFEAE